MDIQKTNSGGWVYYSSFNRPDYQDPGKWMYFFTEPKIAEKICERAIEESIVESCKHTDMIRRPQPTGVICLYADAADSAAVLRIAEWMIANNLVKKTKSGKLYNIAFKLDEQTRAGEYSDNFKPQIQLSDIIDLTTGKSVSNSKLAKK